MQIGIRDLKAHLSAYVKSASSGERVIITDRGVVVAQIVPAEGDAVLQRLIDEGLAMPPAHRQRRMPRPLVTDGPISDLVAEQRE
jgi:prevent-host-death family protein